MSKTKIITFLSFFCHFSRLSHVPAVQKIKILVESMPFIDIYNSHTYIKVIQKIFHLQMGNMNKGNINKLMQVC